MDRRAGWKVRQDRFQAAWLYLGAVVGAGFATGREILQFFSFYGTWGMVGALLAGALFALAGGAVAAVAARHGPGGTTAYFRAIAAPGWARILNTMTAVFYFAVLAVTLAGLAELLTGMTALGRPAGLALAVAVVTTLMAAGRRGLTLLGNLAGPVLVLCVLGLAAAVLAGAQGHRAGTRPAFPLVPWWLSAILYYCYNHVLSLAVLTSAPDLFGREAAIAGGVLGGLMLGLLLVAVTGAVAAALPGAAAEPFPLAFAADSLGAPWPVFYRLMLALAMLTTATACLWGLRRRPAGEPATGWEVFLPAGAAALLAGFGFTPLVGVLYPLMGAAGTVTAALLARKLLCHGGLYGGFRGGGRE